MNCKKRDCYNQTLHFSIREMLEILENAFKFPVYSKQYYLFSCYHSPITLIIPISIPFSFQKLSAPEIYKDTIYNILVNSMVDRVFVGYNCSVFAYGQAGNGKTYIQ